MAFVEMDAKDWDKSIKKEDMEFKNEEDPIKISKNLLQGFKIGIKIFKIGVIQMLRSKKERMTTKRGDFNPII